MLFAAGKQSLPLLRPRVTAIRTMASLPHRRWAKARKAPMVTPDQSLAHAMPTTVREMDNSSLITLAAMNDNHACSEMFIRHIMSEDRVSYSHALITFEEVEKFHKEGMTMFLMPYQIGIVTALTAGFASIPLCFHLPTVQSFNEFYVTTDVPEPRDLETWLEVGSWSWNWMEPALGQISFFLLCLQFSRYVCSSCALFSLCVSCGVWIRVCV